ncbi:glycogen synthase GlgA [Candidatus Methylobacter oryzae]|uniref:Glycogen synthase n=1 Tax=Candidatus Methylobacter oryzae TaxID=2497749 RepID=A0ABY3C5T0_9GAMM|nr:glycogen synthase GlgA [Candidatus Methylobacter oryzae]TRW90378.1 glycogen synthase GlgA [Candidatus Methylobacter oryzae]
MKKILFVTSEAHPLIKTGGLADVSGSLPKALSELGEDVRIIMPNYQAINRTEEVRYLSTVYVNNYAVNILETRLPGTGVTVWLVDCPEFFNYPGNPYVDEHGKPWANGAERFALFCRVTVEVAMNRSWLDWKPDIVHCNDWQSGLVPALLSLEYSRPAIVFTIHNMAYQGIFPKATYLSLNLPGQLWNPHGIEFHDMLSFLKGGLVYSDRITTVSPTYAKEIQTAEFGYGLEGLLSYRKDFLSGIINGIDSDHWNPETDANIVQTFNHSTLNKKQLNKAALQEKVSLPVDKSIPVFGLISRLVEQKGIDLILECLPEMLTHPLQFVLLGSGNKGFEQRLHNFAESHPDKISITIGYDETLAHLIEAGADIFLMPSRFEPCGLNQIYSQRYGTIPIVRKTGGLADTVIDTVPETLNNNTATGLVFNEANAGTLMEAIKRSLILYNHSKTWKQLQINGMQKDYSWSKSAKQYMTLYSHL